LLFLLMVRIYISYSLTLLSALMVWWIFGLFAVFAAGYTWLPSTAFLASVIHFGISSWLFLAFPKPGKILSLATTALMCAWPVDTLFSSGVDQITALLFLAVLVFCAAVTYNHIRTFNDQKKPATFIRFILIIVPFTLFGWYVIKTYKYFI